MQEETHIAALKNIFIIDSQIYMHVPSLLVYW